MAISDAPRSSKVEGGRSRLDRNAISFLTLLRTFALPKREILLLPSARDVASKLPFVVKSSLRAKLVGEVTCPCDGQAISLYCKAKRPTLRATIGGSGPIGAPQRTINRW